MYVRPNFRFKKELREAVMVGKPVQVISLGMFPAPTEGRTAIEGPYPGPHRWYAEVEVHNGLVAKVIS